MTQRAVGLHATLAAAMLVEQGERHACVALHAVEEIDAETFPATTHVTEGAVVNLPTCKQFNNESTVSQRFRFPHRDEKASSCSCAVPQQ